MPEMLKAGHQAEYTVTTFKINSYSFVGKYAGVSSLLLMISLHLSNVWKTVKVSPML